MSSIPRPSGESYSFDISLADAYGVIESLIIRHFQHWIRINKRGKRNFKDSRTWTYQTLEFISDHFPFLSKKQVRRAIDSLVENDVLIKGNYNKDPKDQTLWYSFVREDIYIPNIQYVEDLENPGCPKGQMGQKDYEGISHENDDPQIGLADLPKREIADAQKGNCICTDPKLPDSKPKPPTTPTPPISDSIDSVGPVGGFSSLDSFEKGSSSDNLCYVVFFCLKDVPIKEEDKLRLSQQFPEPTVQKAVTHCMGVDFKPQKSLDASLFYFCKNPQYIPKSPEEIALEKRKDEERRDIAIWQNKQKAEGIEKEKWTILKQLEIYYRTYSEYVAVGSEKIYYKDSSFNKLFDHTLVKLGVA